jgi:pimeloyl-ACP methyl ester carboxylesterase
MTSNKFVTIDGARISYIRKGQGSPLVLLHGSGAGDARDWQFSLLDDFAKTHDVIAFDRPGIGASDLINNVADPFAQAAVLKKATQSLGIENPVLVGHSFGGLVALCWGLLNPKDIAGICAVSPVCMPLGEKLPAILNILNTPIVGGLMARMACSVMRKKAIEDSVKQAFCAMGCPDDYLATTGEILFRSPKEQQNIAHEILGAFAMLPEISARYKNLDVPVEIVFGTEDQNAVTKTHAQPLADALPRANLTLIDKVAHMPHYQAPNAVLDAVARLVK